MYQGKEITHRTNDINVQAADFVKAHRGDTIVAFDTHGIQIKGKIDRAQDSRILLVDDSGRHNGTVRIDSDDWVLETLESTSIIAELIKTIKKISVLMAMLREIKNRSTDTFKNKEFTFTT